MKNLTHILLYRGSENLLDLKSPYTEHPENLVPVIDDLTLKKNSSFSILDDLKMIPYRSGFDGTPVLDQSWMILILS